MKLTRTGPGGSRQILAVNIDVAFLVCGLDADFNANRLDRYLVQARQSGARPVVVLTFGGSCRAWNSMSRWRRSAR